MPEGPTPPRPRGQGPPGEDPDRPEAVRSRGPSPEDFLHKLIVMKVAKGHLPSVQIARMWGAAAEGEPCDGCDEPIDPPGYAI